MNIYPLRSPSSPISSHQIIEEYDPESTPVSSSTSTVASAKPPPSKGVFTTLKETFFQWTNWVTCLFKRLFSCCFKQKSPLSIPLVKVEETKLMRCERDTSGKFSYVVLHNGKATANTLTLRKDHDTLEIQDFYLPDQGIREHMPSYLEQILRQEEASFFSTNQLAYAKILWDLGLKTDAELKCFPDKKDPMHEKMREVLGIAKKKQGLREAEKRMIQKLGSLLHPPRGIFIFDNWSGGDGSVKVSLQGFLSLLGAIEEVPLSNIPLTLTNRKGMAPFKRVPST